MSVRSKRYEGMGGMGSLIGARDAMHNQKFRTAWPQACAQHANTIKTWRQMIEEMRGKFNCFHLLLLSLKLQLSPA